MNIKSFVFASLAVLSNQVLADWYTLTVNPSNCYISQSDSSQQCSVDINWQTEQDMNSPGAPTITFDGQSLGTSYNGMATVNATVGSHTVLMAGAVRSVTRTVTVQYESYSPLFNYDSNTHLTVEGDFDGDGDLDLFIQPKTKANDTGLMPKNSNDYLDSTIHKHWVGQHPQITTIEDWSDEYYAAYSANLTIQPGDELLLLGRQKVILLHGDIVTPITLLKDPRNAIVSWDSNNNPSYTTFDFDANPDNFVVHFGDFDGDGLDEILLQGRSKGATSYILESNGSIKQTLANGYMGLDWSAAAYDFVISDIDGDGRDDIQMSSKVSGVPDNFAYMGTDGKVKNLDESYFLDNEPQAATLPGTTGGEFRVTESGSATFTIPLSAPAGTAGVAPQFSISYSSAAGNGPLGLGWSLSGLSSISRCPHNPAQNGEIRGVELNDEDRFCMDGQQLFEKSGTYGGHNATYKTEMFSPNEISSLDTDSEVGPDTFIVKTRSGDTHYYGKVTTPSGIKTDALVRSTDGQVNRTWRLKRTVDVAGNYIDYNYGSVGNGAEVYISSVEYTGNEAANLSPYNKIQFVYADEINKNFSRPDQMLGYASGATVHLTKLLKQIRIFSNDLHVNTYQIYHEVAEFGDLTRVTAVQQCTYLGNCVEPVRFDYSEAYSNLYSGVLTNDVNVQEGLTLALDINASGKTDLMYWYNDTIYVSIDGNPAVKTNTTIAAEDFVKLKPIDVAGDGKIDFLFPMASGSWKLVTYSEAFNRLDAISYDTLSLNENVEKIFVVDLDGDAKQDFITIENGWVYWYRQNYSTQVVQNCEGGNIDFGGQICVNETRKFYFADEPQLVSFVNGLPASEGFSTATSSVSHKDVRFNDFNGDGITDLVVKASSVSLNRDLVDRDTPQTNPYEPEDNMTQFNTGYFAYVIDKSSGTPQLKPFGLISTADINAITPVDVNRDGLTDVVYVRDGYWRFKLSYGGVSGLSAERDTGIPASEDENINKKALTLDYDQDGGAELWVFREWGTDSGFYNIYKFTERTAEFKHQIKSDLVIPKNPIPLVGDFNNDGMMDLALRKDGHWEYFYVRGIVNDKSIKPNLVTEIDTGYGNKTKITYSNLLDDSVYTHGAGVLPEDVVRARMAMPVVKRVQSTTGSFINNTEQLLAISYHYEDFQAHTNGRGVLGFNKLTTTDEQTGVVTTTEYAQAFPFIGSPIKTVKQLPNGQLLSEANNFWAEKSYADGVFTYIERSVEDSYSVPDLPNPNSFGSVQTQFISRTINENVYDDTGYGLLMESYALTATNKSIDSARVTGGTQWFHSKTVNNYGSTDYEKRYARLASTSVTKTRHDVSGSETKASQFTYFPEGYAGAEGFAGMLRTEVVNNGTNKQVLKEYVYDQFGNTVKVTSKAKTRNAFSLAWEAEQSRSTTSVYDAKGRFVASTSNDLGDTETFEYHPRFGGVTKQTGPNGLSTYFDYDEQGVKYHSQSVNGTFVREYTYLCSQGLTGCPSGAVYYSESRGYDANGNPMTGYSRQFFNKMGQEIVSTNQTFNGQTIVKRAEFDEYGRSNKVYVPTMGNINTVGVHATTYTFDLLGRVVSETAADGGITIRSYNGLTNETTNAIGQKHTETKNINGELVSVIDNAGKALSYVYGTRGNFISLSDSKGNKVENEYDEFGDKIRTSDPDKGTWQYAYNAFGEMIRQQDARGVVITQEYDQLGRMIRRVDNATGIAGIDTQTTCWDYITQAEAIHSAVAKAIGKPRSVAIYQGSVNCDSTNQVALKKVITDYDHLGRAVASTQVIKNESDNNTQSYITMSVHNETTGRVDEAIYPRDVTIKSHYDQYGNVTKITNADDTVTYKQIQQIDQFGNITQSLLGNGVTETKIYDDRTGYIKGITAGLNAGSELVDLEQSFDLIGNVTRRNDRLINRDEVFYYNENGSTSNANMLNRLSSFTVNGSLAKSYTYDELGNISSKSDIGNYLYGNAVRTAGGNAGVHALRQINNSSGTKVRSFNYDANGNMLSDIDHINSANNRTFQYAAFEKPVRVQKGSNTVVSFKYGADRSRYRRVDNVLDNGTPTSIETTYLGVYEKVVHTGGSKNGLTEHKYYIGGVAILVEKEQGGSVTESKMHYMHTDHQGSIIALSDSGGAEEQRFRYDPFGKQYAAVKASGIYNFAASLTKHAVMDKGYTGHEMVNPVDIIHMNGRIYDANLGRFLQADPHIQAPKNLQNMNRYAYVLNNPMSYTDPSGYFFKSLKKYWKTIASVAVGIMTAGAGLGWALGGGFLTGYITTGSLRGAIAGAMSAGLFYGIGTAFQEMAHANMINDLKGALEAGKVISALGALSKGAYLTASQMAQKVVAHAIAGGVSNLLQGGKFGHGVASAGITQSFAPGIDSLTSKTKRIIAASVLGGTSSALTGGKFANGAVTAMFSRAFNDESHKDNPYKADSLWEQIKYDYWNGRYNERVFRALWAYGAIASGAGQLYFGVRSGSPTAAVIFGTHGLGNIGGGLGDYINILDGGDRDWNFTKSGYEGLAEFTGLGSDFGKTMFYVNDLVLNVTALYKGGIQQVFDSKTVNGTLNYGTAGTIEVSKQVITVNKAAATGVINDSVQISATYCEGSRSC
ncbi:MAG: hypothetical protein HWE27_10535 [Gammaproteobacteria bacterium]|nr:hypothetical protein [Gammaproteobacteria bacterium]